MLRKTVAAGALVPSTASATWSVIASTGAPGASSSRRPRVNNNDEFPKAYRRSSSLVRAWRRGRRRGQHAQEPDAGVRGAQKGTDPAHHRASARPGVQSRQFGILDLQGRHAGHPASPTATFPRHPGQCPARRSYSIQGNILRAGWWCQTPQAFVNAKGAITDRVMAAMEAADGPAATAAARVRHGRPMDEARDSVRRQDGARRLHPHGRAKGHLNGIRTTMQRRCTSRSRSQALITDLASSSRGESQSGSRSGYDAWRKTQPATNKGPRRDAIADCSRVLMLTGGLVRAEQNPPPPGRRGRARAATGRPRTGRGAVQVMTLTTLCPTADDSPEIHQAADEIPRLS